MWEIKDEDLGVCVMVDGVFCFWRMDIVIGIDFLGYEKKVVFYWGLFLLEEEYNFLICFVVGLCCKL